MDIHNLALNESPDTPLRDEVFGAFATGSNCSACVGVRMGEHPRGYRQHCGTAGLDCNICGRAKVLTVPPEPEHDRGASAQQRAASGRTVNITGLKPNTRRFASGLAGRDPSTLQAFCVFGQFLSPRVFLTQVSGRRRVRQGKEKFHRRPAGSETPWK